LTAGAISLILLALTACTTAQALRDPGVGPDPALPAPQKSLIPTVHIAPAKGWPPGASPSPRPECA
jgi:hypothetical protein